MTIVDPEEIVARASDARRSGEVTAARPRKSAARVIVGPGRIYGREATAARAIAVRASIGA